jgi:DNA-binding transcriptional MerR regulator
MEITLEKIELVKDRTGVSYKEAKEALEAADGNVVDAIINIEESIEIKSKSKLSEQSAALLEKLKEIVKKGNVSRIVVKKNDEVMLNMPINIGLIGSLIAPLAVVVGTIAALGAKCKIEIIKDNGEIIDFSEIAMDTFDDVKEKGSAFADEMRVKGGEVYHNVKDKTNEAINKATKKDASPNEASEEPAAKEAKKSEK